MDERILIRLIKEGDKKAYDSMVRLYFNRVYKTAYFILRDPEEAADVSQDVFVKVYKKRKMLDDKRSIYPLLYRITKNMSLNCIRRRKKKKIVSYDDDWIASNHIAPETVFLMNGIKREVKSAVYRLPEKLRKVIILNHFDGLSYKEISEILDIPIGTVMSRLFNARTKLKDLLPNSAEVADDK